MSTERTQQHIYELNTESRLTKLESTNEAILRTLAEIKSDINNKFEKIDNRLWYLYTWTGAGFSALLAVMAHGFHWI